MARSVNVATTSLVNCHYGEYHRAVTRATTAYYVGNAIATTYGYQRARLFTDGIVAFVTAYTFMLSASISVTTAVAG